MTRPHQQGLEQRGFTLLELMIVLAIVAVHGVLALPLFRSYVARA